MIILCGLPRTGKTFYGKLLADALACPFRDLDHLVEEHVFLKQNQIVSCKDFVSIHGEKAFRQLEYECLKELYTFPQGILSLGGGTLLYPPSLKLTRKMGIIVHLSFPLNEIMKKFLPNQQSPIPVPETLKKLYRKGTLKNALKRRATFFSQNAHISLPLYPHNSPQDNLLRIIKAIEPIYKSHE